MSVIKKCALVTGEDPRLHGLYHNCGYNSAGMMLGGGCGEQMAIWITKGRPDLHMLSYDIRYDIKLTSRRKPNHRYPIVSHVIPQPNPTQSKSASLTLIYVTLT